MSPSHRKVQVNFGLEIVQKSCDGDEEKSQCDGHDVEADQNVLNMNQV